MYISCLYTQKNYFDSIIKAIRYTVGSLGIDCQDYSYFGVYTETFIFNDGSCITISDNMTIEFESADREFCLTIESV